MFGLGVAVVLGAVALAAGLVISVVADSADSAAAEVDYASAGGDPVAPITSPPTTFTPTTTAGDEHRSETAPIECNGVCAHIVGSTVTTNGELLIEWMPVNFDEPSLDHFHAHLFYDTFRPEQVGSNAAHFGVAQGNWQLTGDTRFDSTGTSVSVAGAPAGAEKLCIVVADSGHGVVNPENAECVDLP